MYCRLWYGFLLLVVLALSACSITKVDPVTGKTVNVISLGSPNVSNYPPRKTRLPGTISSRRNANNTAFPPATNLSPKERFLKKNNVLGNKEIGRKLFFEPTGRMFEYKDSAGVDPSERAQSAKDLVSDMISRRQHCPTITRTYPTRSGSLVKFWPRVRDNYLSLICKGNCENIFYKIGNSRASYYQYLTSSPYPRLWIQGSAGTEIHVLVGQYLNEKFVPLSKGTEVTVIHWTSAFMPRCSYSY